MRSPGAHGCDGTVECRSLKRGGCDRDDKNTHRATEHGVWTRTTNTKKLAALLACRHRPPIKYTVHPLHHHLSGNDALTRISALYRTVGAPVNDPKIAPSCTRVFLNKIYQMQLIDII